MRQEPKMYKSTKPKDATVDSDVVAAHIADDGFQDMVNRFFKWIGDNVEFEEYKPDNNEIKISGHTFDQNMAMMGHSHNLSGVPNYGY